MGERSSRVMKGEIGEERNGRSQRVGERVEGLSLREGGRGGFG